MNDESLERTAREHAAVAGWDEEAYDLAETRREDGVAWLMFRGRSQRPGDHFSVGIRLEDGKVLELIPGR